MIGNDPIYIIKLFRIKIFIIYSLRIKIWYLKIELNLCIKIFKYRHISDVNKIIKNINDKIILSIFSLIMLINQSLDENKSLCA